MLYGAMGYKHTKEECIYCKRKTPFFIKYGFCRCKLTDLKARFIKIKNKKPDDNKREFMYYARLSYTAKVASIKRKEKIANGTYKQKNRRPRITNR